MSTSTSISVGWPIPTGLTVKKEKNGAGHIATFSWDKISDAELAALDPSGGGYYNIYWRVMINDKKTYLAPAHTFTISVPQGCCKMCVKVAAIYDLSETSYIYTDLAVSEYCGECCVDCDPDPYCESVKSIGNTTRTQNYGSANMRYARAISIGGANAFR